MSTLKRYNLLASWYQYDTKHLHTLHGTVASLHNNMLINEVNFAWSTIIDDFLSCDGYSEQARNSKLRNWFKVCSCQDYAAIIGTCKAAYDLLIDNMSKGINDLLYVDFKDQLTCFGLTRAVIGELFSPISTHLNHCLTTPLSIVNSVFRSECVKSLEICSSFLLFPKKINFTDIGLEAKALRDYMEIEQDNKNLTLDPAVIRSLKSIITDWFKGYEYDFSLVRHGPGSVADADNNKSAKYKSFHVDSKLSYFLRMTSSKTVDNLYSDVIRCNTALLGLKRHSELVFVPKDVTKLRSISKEPAILQYFQQAGYRSIQRFMRSHEVGQHINLSDQGQNRTLAYDGSLTNQYATLDLSSASDTVLWSLVKDLFSGVPELLKVLICTRSTHTILPTGDLCELSKFAPMGSALCFPIESIIFAAIAKLSIARGRGNHRLVPKTVTTFFSVFGDDIIVPRYAVEECISLLTKCGFRLNKSKSFLDGPFKESCGGNYYCGHDITGLKFKPCFDEQYLGNVSPNSYNALIAYANYAYTKNFKTFRCYCIHKLLDNGHKPLFGSDMDNNSMVFSSTPTNFHLTSRVNHDYQITEAKRTIVSSVVKQMSDCEVGLYSEWCLSKTHAHSELWSEISPGHYDLNLRMPFRHEDFDSRILCFRYSWLNVDHILYGSAVRTVTS